MGKLIAGTVICAAIVGAAPAWAVSVDTPQDQGQQTQQIYLRETQKVTARAQLIYKLADNASTPQPGAVEGRAEVVERSQGLVIYETGRHLHRRSAGPPGEPGPHNDHGHRQLDARANPAGAPPLLGPHARPSSSHRKAEAKPRTESRLIRCAE